MFIKLLEEWPIHRKMQKAGTVHRVEDPDADNLCDVQMIAERCTAEGKPLPKAGEGRAETATAAAGETATAATPRRRGASSGSGD